jgi:hypothetical protein
MLERIKIVSQNEVHVVIPGRSDMFCITSDDGSAYDIALRMFYPEYVYELDTMEIVVQDIA